MSGEEYVSDCFNSGGEGSIPVEHLPKGYSDINEVDSSL